MRHGRVGAPRPAHFLFQRHEGAPGSRMRRMRQQLMGVRHPRHGHAEPVGRSGGGGRGPGRVVGLAVLVMRAEHHFDHFTSRGRDAKK